MSPPRQQVHGRYYVYRLIDPRNGSIFYVGKGQGKRAWQHESVVLGGKPDCNSRKAEVIADILALGLHVEVEIVERFDDADDALDLEYRLIREMPTLTNERSGFNNGAQVEARLQRVREAKRVRLERQFRDDEIIRGRLDKLLRLAKTPRQKAEARAWVEMEVRQRLMNPNSRVAKRRMERARPG